MIRSDKHLLWDSVKPCYLVANREGGLSYTPNSSLPPPTSFSQNVPVCSYPGSGAYGPSQGGNTQVFPSGGHAWGKSPIHGHEYDPTQPTRAYQARRASGTLDSRSSGPSHVARSSENAYLQVPPFSTFNPGETRSARYRRHAEE